MQEQVLEARIETENAKFENIKGGRVRKVVASEALLKGIGNKMVSAIEAGDINEAAQWANEWREATRDKTPANKPKDDGKKGARPPIDIFEEDDDDDDDDEDGVRGEEAEEEDSEEVEEADDSNDSDYVG